ncbi:MAG: glycosyl transferase, partial [Mollicutes bacterium]|nr:glycosyl transferase [Mollicutes bacterium]
KISELLSKDIIFVRVDFYETNGRLYFGELTFFPGSGFEEFTPKHYDYLLGSWIRLPKDS